MLDDLVECKLCGRKFKYINYRHMAHHGLTTAQYKEQFPDAPVASKNFVAGFIESRMNDETEAKRKAAAAKACGDPKVVAKRAASIRLHYADPAARARRSEQALVSTRTESARKHYSESMKRRWADKEFKARTVAKIVATHRRPEVKQKHKEAMDRVRARPGFREKMSASGKQRWESNDYRARVTPILAEANRRPEKRLKDSLGVVHAMIAGKMPHLGLHGVHGKFYSSKNNKHLPYRSSYELAAFRVLEQLSVVASYDHECLHIPYVDEFGQRRNYLPDILVKYTNGNMDLIEVKPKWNLDTEENKAKFKAAREYCRERGWSFSVWTEDQLRMQ